MALNINNAPKSSGKVSPIPEADTHRAVVIEVIGLGLQDCGSWKGEKKPNKVKIRLTYELPDQTAEFDGETKPLIVSEEINFSNHEKSDLVARFNQLDPTNEFKGDITKLLGKSCLVTVSHRVGTGKFAGRTFANIAAVSALPKILPKVEEIFMTLMSLMQRSSLLFLSSCRLRLITALMHLITLLSKRLKKRKTSLISHQVRSSRPLT